MHIITQFYFTQSQLQLVSPHSVYIGDVLLRCENSLKVICEKVKSSTLVSVIIFVTTNGMAYELFINIPNDVQTKGKGEINTA